MKDTKNLSMQAVCRAAVLAAMTLGLTAVGMAQQSTDPDPAAQNEAPVPDVTMQLQPQTPDVAPPQTPVQAQAPAPAQAPAEPTQIQAAPAPAPEIHTQAMGPLSDAQVEANVLSALAGAQSLADQPISTTTTFGTVTLSGTVKDVESKKLAARLASISPGVKKVMDELVVGDIGEAAPAGEGAAQMPNAQQSQQAMNQQPQYGTPAPPKTQEYGPNAQPYGYAPGPGRYTGQPGGQEAVVPAGKRMQIRVSQGMDGKHTKVGTTFNGVLMNDVLAGGLIALPRGAEVQGVVVAAKAGGGLSGSGEIGLQLTGVQIGRMQYPLESQTWGYRGPSKTGNTVGNTIGMGALGAFIGAAAGGGPGAAIGAVAGGTAGIGMSAASSGPQAGVRPESLITFVLDKPVTVTTVSQDELNRLAQYAPPPAGYMQQRPPRPGYYRPYYGYPY